MKRPALVTLILVLIAALPVAVLTSAMVGTSAHRVGAHLPGGSAKRRVGIPIPVGSTLIGEWSPDRGVEEARSDEDSRSATATTIPVTSAECDGATSRGPDQGGSTPNQGHIGSQTASSWATDAAVIEHHLPRFHAITPPQPQADPAEPVARG